ncbi:MAG: YdjY domain-containing protein [bacterium]
MTGLIHLSILFGISLPLAASCGQLPPPPVSADPAAGIIQFEGTIFPRRYNSHPDRANGHHFIVWSGGANAAKALINTAVSDREILKALESVGAVVGNNLTPATWEQRADPAASAPDQRVEGSLLEIRVRWNGREHPIQDLFQDKNPLDFAIRAGGNEKLIPVWRSGCVTCLFSCPGGKTSNAAYTIRDQYWQKKVFLADAAALPPDGAQVRVIMRVIQK